MLHPRTAQYAQGDPEGYYALLGVAPSADPNTITAAFRRMARTVHPDVPGTGDASAFMAIKQAYDILSHVERRARYDLPPRPRPAAGPRFEGEPGEIDPLPFPVMDPPSTRHPRWHDLPVAVWGGLAAILVLGVVQIALHLHAAPSGMARERIQANAPDVPKALAALPPRAAFGPAPLRLAGTPNFYVVPAASPTTLWRADESAPGVVPWGHLPPFTAVQGMRLLKANGMVEVRVTDTANGLIEAARLTPGDPAAAWRGWCAYNAGAAPANAEVLSHRGEGTARLPVDNRSGQPAVVKLRAPDGSVVASVFLSPGGQAVLDNLPRVVGMLDIATGEVWSRACHGFTAGMRAQRVSRAGGMMALTIPPDAASAPEDIADQVFEQE